MNLSCSDSAQVAAVEKNLKRGENHPRAKLTDHEVELMRQMHDEGYGYKRLAKMFETPKTTCRNICNYDTR